MNANSKTYSFNILLQQLLTDNVHITAGIDVSLHVSDILVIEAAEHVENGIHSTNVGKESISQTSTLGSALHQSSNIGNLKNSIDNALGLESLDQIIKTVIGNGHTSNVGVDRAERIILSRNLFIRDCEEQHTFSLDRELNMEDLPTLGTPTIPMHTLFPSYEQLRLKTYRDGPEPRAEASLRPSYPF